VSRFPGLGAVCAGTHFGIGGRAEHGVAHPTCHALERRGGLNPDQAVVRAACWWWVSTSADPRQASNRQGRVDGKFSHPRSRKRALRQGKKVPARGRGPRSRKASLAMAQGAGRGPVEAGHWEVQGKKSQLKEWKNGLLEKAGRPTSQ